MMALSYDGDGNLNCGLERLKCTNNGMPIYDGGALDFTPCTLNFKADETISKGDMVTINNERWKLVGDTELEYQDGVLKYTSAGEITYTGIDFGRKVDNMVIMTSTPSGEKGYFYDTCFPPKSEYYGESMIRPKGDGILSFDKHADSVKVLDVFGEVYGYKRTIIGKRRFVNPYKSLDKNLLVNNKGILEFGNKITTFFGVDFGKPNSDNCAISHTATISGDEFS